MFRLLKQIILGIILIAIVMVALANREMTTVQLIPEPLVPLFGGTNYSVTLPLFVSLLAAIGVGLLVGYLFEWIRERKHRRAVVQRERQVSRLESEVEKLRRKTGEGEDDVLALLN